MEKRPEGAWRSREAAEAEARRRFGPEAWAVVARVNAGLREVQAGRSWRRLAKDLAAALAHPATPEADQQARALARVLALAPNVTVEAEGPPALDVVEADGARAFLRRLPPRPGARAANRANLVRLTFVIGPAWKTHVTRSATAWAYAGIALGLHDPITGTRRVRGEEQDERARFSLLVNQWRTELRRVLGPRRIDAGCGE